MSTIFGTQLEPFEEIQSPSPTETHDNPYETTLAARSSSLPHRRGSGPPSPINTVNTLHRQLSGDPESPPPAWKRRPTVSNRQRSPSSEAHQRSPGSAESQQGQSSQRSPSQSSVKSRNSLNSPNGVSRRPPSGLMMTTAVAAAPSPKSAVPMPNGMFLHESPNGSSTDLANTDLALPNPAFRRRGNGSSSNRSSIASSQDLNSLTSEELWSLGQREDDIPDMSNPMRQAAERPLDTVRRESRRMDQRPESYVHVGLPGDVIWPTAPAVEKILPDNARSKSFTNVATLGMSGRRMSRRAKSRQSSIDVAPINTKDVDAMYKHNTSQPASPGVNGMGALSSAHSSSTSLASQALPPNKSYSSLGGRPPSTYYSRDFLSSLAPREGGYAIAAQMGGGLGAVGTMSVEEKRRSISNFEDVRGARTMGSRAPPSKSAGMGRWSLDGGENYGRPYGTPSAATTSSNLSAPPINSAEPSPPAEELQVALPAGAAPSMSSGPSIPVSTTPPNPSPLSQQNSAQDTAPPAAPAIPAPPPIPASSAPAHSLVSKKSKKQLAKENKAAEKAEAQKVARQRAEAHRAETLRKEAEREAAKRQEKEEKAKRKAEKKSNKKGRGLFGRSTTSSTTTGSGSSTPQPQSHAAPSQPQSENQTPKPAVDIPAIARPTPIAAQHSSSNDARPPSHPESSPATLKPVQAVPVLASGSSSSTGKPFPKPLHSSQSAYKVPVTNPTEPPRQTHRSMPLSSKNYTRPDVATTQSQTPTRPPIEGKRSLFGTIRKRLSYMGGSSEAKIHQVKDTPPPVPPIPSIPASPVVAQHPQNEARPQHPAHNQPVAEDALPPRRKSLVAPTSAKIGSPSSASSPRMADISTPVKSVSSPPQEQTSPAAASTSASNLVLGKSVSRESGSSPLSISRKRNSLHGPRPMPGQGHAQGQGQSRPSSITTHESISNSPHQDRPAGLQQTISTISSSVNHNHSTNGESNSNSGPESSMIGPVTPSTSGDSNSFFHSHSHGSSHITPITSPEDDLTFEHENENENEREVERASSGDSGKTVHGNTGSNGLPSQPILV
ncbi:uncharacterized protein I303_104985 [Kwoniella dejecticola CBS 10117]|uniref:Uncharacterized protein n=1 Tax=Kwoniella dejecticola CBS 10117 TaxID=1296121 RepID=A0A1A6A3T4_9TREE|nr:uncharacterized protein I303_05570 [Kwoniella dejecticola CBS 10117]OBR84711.1 hypothetical protein I303_05570 [Kwoniella dejecticola CBS 10117]